MPQGNHHYTPSGIWYQSPTNSTYPKLLLGTASRIVGFVAILGFPMFWNYLSRHYTYDTYKGKSWTFGTISIDQHEPASVEYIDELKRKMEEERQKKWAALAESS